MSSNKMEAFGRARKPNLPKTSPSKAQKDKEQPLLGAIAKNQQKTSPSKVLQAEPHKPSVGASSKPANKNTQQNTEVLARKLRMFDLDMQYGPFLGMSRKKRWQRAHKFELNPPQDVLEIIEMDIFEDVPLQMGVSLKSNPEAVL